MSSVILVSIFLAFKNSQVSCLFKHDRNAPVFIQIMIRGLGTKDPSSDSRKFFPVILGVSYLIYTLCRAAQF